MDWFSPTEDRIYELARRLLTEYVESRPEYGREWILAGGVTCTGSFVRRRWHTWPIPAEAPRRILAGFVLQRPEYEPVVAEVIFSAGSKQSRSLGPQILAPDVTSFRFNQYRVRGADTAIGRFSLIGTAGKIAELEVNYGDGAAQTDREIEAWLSEQLRKLI